MTERQQNISGRFMKGVNGAAYFLNEATGFASVAVSSDGGVHGKPEHIAFINSLRPQNQSLQDYVREQAGYKPKGQ